MCDTDEKNGKHFCNYVMIYFDKHNKATIKHTPRDYKTSETVTHKAKRNVPKTGTMHNKTQ